MKRTLTIAAAAAIGAAALTGCSDGDSTAYAPDNYGANGQCYYIDNPAEVAALQAAGLCPVGWIAYPAPVWYRARYAGYFDSPAYYNHYVPVSVRKVYVTHVTTWNKTNSSAIKTQQRVSVGNNKSSYSSGNSRGDRAGGGQSSSSSGLRVSVGSSSRSYSSGSRR